MAVYTMGSIMKEARIRNRLSQEELCYGICSVSTLSKIENGYQMPAAKRFFALMERAGLSPYTYNHFVSYNEWKKHKLEMRILNNIFRGEDISAYLLEYGNEMNGDDRLECQLFEMGKLMGKDIEKVPLDKILKILAYTLKDSNIDNIRTLHTYSTQEMILLCMLSRKLYLIGKKDKAREIQDCLLRYWKNMDADICGRSTQYLYLLHSLLLNLYNEEKYYEAISICQEAIEIGKEHKNMFFMIEFYCYNGTVLSNYIGDSYSVLFSSCRVKCFS